MKNKCFSNKLIKLIARLFKSQKHTWYISLPPIKTQVPSPETLLYTVAVTKKKKKTSLQKKGENKKTRGVASADRATALHHCLNVVVVVSQVWSGSRRSWWAVGDGSSTRTPCTAALAARPTARPRRRASNTSSSFSCSYSSWRRFVPYTPFHIVCILFYSHLHYNGHFIAGKAGQTSRLIPSFPLFPHLRQ